MVSGMKSSTTYPSFADMHVLAAADLLMRETMARYDVSHDAHHVQRVRRTAVKIALSMDPKPDLLVVELGALLHDILDKKYVSKEEAADPLGFFTPFFEGVSEHVDLLEDGRAKLIVKVVENVSWTTEKMLRAEGAWSEWHATCTELHCVQDADRLDAIGAIGVLRCAAFSCAANRVLCTDKDDPLYPETSLAHFYDKLLHIKDRLKTELGRELGRERHNLMVTFVKALESETSA